MSVKAKKHLGQHFLKDKNICKKIAEQFQHHQGVKTAIEIGPGMGALTEYLLHDPETDLYVMDVDSESIDYLKVHFPQLEGKIVFGDFLKMDLKDSIPEIMGMFQKEVAQRVAEKPGTKTYGILSVLLQAYYDIEYCFTVDEHVFDPPPKVKSGVIRCTRNNRDTLPCDEKLFKQVVKMSFNQRRKTIRNSIKALLPESYEDNPMLQLRPERLGVEEFIELTNWIANNKQEGSK